MTVIDVCVVRYTLLVPGPPKLDKVYANYTVLVLSDVNSVVTV